LLVEGVVSYICGAYLCSEHGGTSPEDAAVAGCHRFHRSAGVSISFFSSSIFSFGFGCAATPSMPVVSYGFYINIAGRRPIRGTDISGFQKYQKFQSKYRQRFFKQINFGKFCLDEKGFGGHQ
jgi:hypothetical protein